MKVCNQPGCPELTTEPWCPAHKPPPWASSTGRERTKSPAWLRIRKAILDRDRRRCYACGGSANEVDHIVPVFEGGTDVESNLAAICTSCHRRKTAHEGVRARSTGGG